MRFENCVTVMDWVVLRLIFYGSSASIQRWVQSPSKWGGLWRVVGVKLGQMTMRTAATMPIGMPAVNMWTQLCNISCPVSPEYLPTWDIVIMSYNLSFVCAMTLANIPVFSHNAVYYCWVPRQPGFVKWGNRLKWSNLSLIKCVFESLPQRTVPQQASHQDGWWSGRYRWKISTLLYETHR